MIGPLSFKDICFWIYSEFMATFRPEPYFHVCQNFRFAFGLPMRWHTIYEKFIPEELGKKNSK